MLTYQNVTPDQIAAMKAKLELDGATVTEGPEGVYGVATFIISGHGVSVDANYSATTQTLNVQANFLIRGAVDKGIKEALGRARAV